MKFDPEKEKEIEKHVFEILSFLSLPDNLNEAFPYDDLKTRFSVHSEYHAAILNRLWPKYVNAGMNVRSPKLKIKSDGMKYLNRLSGELIADERKNEIDELSYRKLKIDVKTAERIYKSYPKTQAIAWISFFVMLVLGFLKLAEALHIWPYHNKG